MGRVSKYVTAEERLEAAKERKRVYAKTKEAKLLRREQNRRAYVRRTEGRSKLSPTWPTIPRALHQQAALSLPQQSHFFLREYRAREDISDDDPLAKWDLYPPYNIPDGSIGSDRLEAIVESVHGRRLREQYQQEARRLQRHDKATDDEMLAEIDRDINTYLTSWHDLQRILKTLPPSGIDHTMGQHLMQWKARRVVDLLKDWKVVKRGRANDAFTCHFTNRW